ncbi:enoyl-CoA hydratase/isomerase family protein [Paludibacterium paludis]|uniref:Enoyl-CoA hydratase n=1 Tax=Paludibacterium paludis TaxID=1225769 RepID=A0A918U7U2_9NEIS|nr:enoyl-CoA hydratase/isomerase family protein [Paludibacterium paludis]GGY06090.1 enoyl-CoA hydratase [Paludibacterium paludis]
MTFQTLELTGDGAVATVWLNRPDVHNAFNDILIGELTHAVESLQKNESVRVIVLAGRGKSFCAGADLDWMRRAAEFTEQENRRDANALALLFRTLYRSPKPVIARIHGPAIAGGTGLAAAADIVIATDKAVFGLSEVRLGLIPATIGPYVAEAIGPRQARRYFLSAERIDVERARQLGLVHEVVAEEALDDTVAAIAGELVRGGPYAQRECRELLETLAQGSPWDDGLLEDTASRIAAIRVTPEAREGLNAFFEKRPANWNRE